MKAAPVYRELAKLDTKLTLRLVHTGQHYDSRMSEVFLEQLQLPEPDLFLGVGSGTHAEQTAKALVGVERVLIDDRPDVVVVAGDVNSTLAAALAASKLQVPVVHIEAGLRSFDETMPEEANRRLTDHLSQLLLAHSQSAVANLVRENVDSSRIHLVGNTMIDSVFRHLPAAEGLRPWVALGVEPRKFGLVTLHRPALVDSPGLLAEAIEALTELARETDIVFPVHPRTRERLLAAGVDLARLLQSRLQLCEPLDYLTFLGLEANAAFVLTDSGGIQEETSALGVRCFTLRDSTERPVTVDLGTNTLLGLDPRRIAEIEPSAVTVALTPLPLWDGRAGRRAAKVIADFLSDLRCGRVSEDEVAPVSGNHDSRAATPRSARADGGRVRLQSERSSGAPSRPARSQ
jgi:UDP-N-acetylglucosamine 2-epimerase (non-hydrolysing)